MDGLKIVENIQRICMQKNTSPSVACRESGAGTHLVTNLKNKNVMPSIEKFHLLAVHLGVTTSELLGETIGTPADLLSDERQLLLDYRALNQQGQEFIRQTMYVAGQTYKKSSDVSGLERQA